MPPKKELGRIGLFFALIGYWTDDKYRRVLEGIMRRRWPNAMIPASISHEYQTRAEYAKRRCLKAERERDALQDQVNILLAGAKDKVNRLLGTKSATEGEWQELLEELGLKTPKEVGGLINMLGAASTKDFLTGLNNRRGLEERFEPMVAGLLRELPLSGNQDRRHHPMISVLAIDLDFFKRANDEFGHKRGDLVLQTVAALMHTHFGRDDDIHCRLGGDEFLVVMPRASALDAGRQANKFLKAMQEHRALQFVEGEPGVTASIGIASVRLELFSMSAEELLDELNVHADEALRAAKESGRNTIRYSEENTQPAAL